MPDTIDHDTNEPKMLPPRERKSWVSTRALGIGGAIAILAVGAALGAGGTRLAQTWEPQRVMLLQPTGIGDLRDDTPVAVKGEVTDVFGNKFVLQDASGRALIDTGPRGEDRRVVSKGESVTVQGHFDRGRIRAQIVSFADGRNEAFGPPGPKGPKEAKEPKGPKEMKEAKEAKARKDARDQGVEASRPERDPPPPPADRDAPSPAPPAR